MRPGLMDRLIYLLLITLQLSLLSQADHAPCYSPNGTSYPDKSKLCNSLDGTVTMCCGQTDTCLFNGLCRIEGYNIWWRDMCSVRTWPEVGCLKVCEVCEIHLWRVFSLELVGYSLEREREREELNITNPHNRKALNHGLATPK